MRAALAILLLLVSVTGCGLFGSAERTAQDFAGAWARGDDAAAAALTDDAPAAQEALGAARAALRPTALTVTVDQVRDAAERADASLTMTWDLGGGRQWSYPTTLVLRPGEQGWRVDWAPSVIHPQLGTGQVLALAEQPAEPAPVLDRAGSPLLTPQNVVSVLLDPAAAGDLGGVAGALAGALARFDQEITRQSVLDGVARTPAGQAYQVAVLREPDYQQVRPLIYELPGVRFTTARRLLAPDAGFARQVLPPVRAALAQQLDGVTGWTVRAVSAAGTPVATLREQPPQPGTAVTVTLDRAVQVAAEDAVEPVAEQAVLIAVQPSTGDLLAVAQNGPADAAGPIALLGRYPPGSTFKIVTAEAALTRGLTPASAVPCPAAATIGGREVPNNDRLDLGTVPLTTAFARSCNTTFAQLAADGRAEDLPASARRLGLGADYAVPGLITVTGTVPPAQEPVTRAADGFGQGDVVASPLGMALVAATVARGGPVVPQLVRDRPTGVLAAPESLQAAVAEQLRAMMRAVVVSGTASALAPLGEVSGKTGTAQFGAGDRAHGWFVGYRGDVAFAVLVVDAGSSAPAVTLAGRFLRALN